MGNMILAPGGGWVSNPDVVALIRPPARLIYLRVRPETALKRLGSERSTRPLLMRPDPLGELRRLLTARKALYESADHVIEAELLAGSDEIRGINQHSVLWCVVQRRES